tara:strand:+ start:275 stop:820 length:546 start_codon:yes stop_codon:yes gene_type:complete
MSEIWKDIPKYENIYQVSNFGNIKRLERYGNYGRHTNAFFPEKLMKQQLDTNGYLRVNLTKDRKKWKISVHQLVILVFKSIKSNRYKVIDHIDNNKLNNKLSNLQVISARENVLKHRKTTNKSSKYPGVYWHKRNKKWLAQTTLKGKHIYIGHYNSELEAFKSYSKQIETRVSHRDWSAFF